MILHNETAAPTAIGHGGDFSKAVMFQNDRTVAPGATADAFVSVGDASAQVLIRLLCRRDGVSHSEAMAILERRPV